MANFELLQNLPNPFRDYTIITYFMPTKEHVTLSIFDVNGVLLVNLLREAKPGYNEIMIENSMLENANGILYYQLKTDDYLGTKKMIRIR